MAMGRSLPRFLRVRATGVPHDHRTPTRCSPAGALVGLGVVLLVVRLMPAEPDLADALGRLTPPAGAPTPLGPVATATRQGADRACGRCKALPPALWVRTPTRELALLRIPLARFYGDKITFAAPRAGDPAAAGVVLRAASASASRRDPGARLARPGRGDVLPAELQRGRRRQEGPARVHPRARRLHRPRRPRAQQRLRRAAGDGVRRRGRRLLGLHPAVARS